MSLLIVILYLYFTFFQPIKSLNWPMWIFSWCILPISVVNLLKPCSNKHQNMFIQIIICNIFHWNRNVIYQITNQTLLVIAKCCGKYNTFFFFQGVVNVGREMKLVPRKICYSYGICCMQSIGRDCVRGRRERVSAGLQRVGRVYLDREVEDTIGNK